MSYDDERNVHQRDHLRRLLGEPTNKPVYECRNQIAMTYHEHIDVLTRLCQTQEVEIQRLRGQLEAARMGEQTNDQE